MTVLRCESLREATRGGPGDLREEILKVLEEEGEWEVTPGIARTKHRCGNAPRRSVGTGIGSTNVYARDATQSSSIPGVGGT